MNFKMKEILIFIIMFLTPFIIFRAFYIITKYSKKFYLGKEMGFKIHHAHLGILLILSASILLLFLGTNIYIITLFGLGLGLALDESISLMVIKTSRKSDLEAYKKSFIKTLILFIIIILIILILSFL